MARPRTGNPGVWGTAGPLKTKSKGKGRSAPPPRVVRTPPKVDSIEELLKAYFAPGLSAIDRERKAAADYNSRRVRDLSGFTTAVMGMLGQVPGMIRGPYESGAQAMQGLGTGYGAALNADTALDASQANAVLQTINAPEGQMLSGGDPGGVLAGLAGWLPSQMMGAQGAALAGAAEALPKTASVQAFIELNKILREGKAEDAAYGSKVEELLSSSPKIRADLESDLAKQNLAEQKFRLDQINDDRNYWLKMQAYYMSIGKLKLAQQAEKRSQAAEKRYANESMGRDAYGGVAPGYVMTDQGIQKRSDVRAAASARRSAAKDKGLAPDGSVLPGYKRLPNGTVVKAYKPAASTAKGPDGKPTLTPNAQAENMTTVLGKQDDIVKTDLPQLAESTGYAALLRNPKASEKEKARLQKSISRALWVRYSPIAVTPQSKRALRAMISRVVKAYKPSGGGSLTEGLLD